MEAYRDEDSLFRDLKERFFWELVVTVFVLYFQKLRVWCRVANGQWQLGMIQSTTADTSLVMLSTANVSFC